MKYKIVSERLPDSTYAYHVLKRSWVGYSTIMTFSTFDEAQEYIAQNE